jgi:Peptidyl-tRNA hydrolase
MALRRNAEERRGTPSVLLIVGLANPGSEYEGSRHNIGGDAVRELANRYFFARATSAGQYGDTNDPSRVGHSRDSNELYERVGLGYWSAAQANLN